MARPKEYLSLPVYGATEIDKVGAVREVLYQLEQGYFFDAARLWDVMRRDDAISGARQTRTNALTQTPIDWQPGKDTPRGRKIQKEAEELWPQMVSAGALGQLAEWGDGLGLGVGELVWSRDWVPRLKVWHPQFVWWDWSSRRLRLQIQGLEDGDSAREVWVDLPRTDRDVYSDGQWVIYTPGGFNECWLRGSMRALAEPYLIRRWGVRDGARLSEVHGIPIRGVVVPSAASEKDKDRFVRSVGRLGNESVIELPVSEPGIGFDVKLVEAVGKGEIIQWSVKSATDSINNVILGQSVGGEKVGGLGDGQTNQQESVRDDIRRADCRIYETLRAQMLRWWTVHNYGDPDLTPNPIPQVDPPEDQAKSASRLVSLSQALPVLKGMGVDTTQVLDDMGVPMLPENERSQPVLTPPQEAPAPVDEAALTALTTVEPGVDPAPASRTYADRLAANSQVYGQDITADWVAKVMDVVNKAKSFEEVKAKLARLYAKASPKQMAELVERAEIMAELAGRYEALKGL